MSLVKLDQAAKITLPPEIREAAHLMAGDYLEAEVTAAGVILLRPVNGTAQAPTAAQEAEIIVAVDEARAANAAKRRR